MTKGMDRVAEVMEVARRRGYYLRGSVFNVDYNGSSFTVGFWISRQEYDIDTDAYLLPGMYGSAQNADFNTAVALASARFLGGSNDT